MKIVIDDEQVSTLESLAKDLSTKCGWTEYRVEGDDIFFTAVHDEKKINGMLELSGFAYDADTGEELDYFNVNWDEDFDAWSDHVWAEDENGNTIMLHN